MKILHINSTWCPNEGSYKNTLVIYDDNWNDFMYRTYFHVVYFNNNGNCIVIGDLKIYYYDFDENRTRDYSTPVSTKLAHEITQLDSDTFCSLGQSLNYYKNLKDAIPVAYRDVLKRLNDIAFNTDLRDYFINEQGVQVSLLRDSSASKALYEAKEYLDTGNTRAVDISFSIDVSVPYTDVKTQISFNFKNLDNIPNRINILVGKNGTGKTHILTQLANCLSGIDSWPSGNPKDRPLVDKVISISYSAFDSFKKRPIAVNTDNSLTYMSNSYVYCGIQSDQGTLSLKELDDTFLKSYEIIVKKNRINAWDSLIRELVGDEHLNIKKMANSHNIKHSFFSSGEHILICTITEALAQIEKGSLLLFDEPELHLHPNAVASVMRMFYLLLDEFDSYAIFATHSPLIVQETPSSYIHVLKRINNSLIVSSPEIECFGENITNITDDIFDVRSNESNYKSIFKALSKKMSFEEVIELFGDKLSFNALIFLKNCYNKNNAKD